MSFSPSPCSLVSKNQAGRMLGAPDDDLHQVVDALHVDAGLAPACPASISPNVAAIVDQRALQHRRDLEALGHDVVGDDALRVGVGERRLELRQVVATARIHGLSARTCRPGADRAADAVDLPAVAAREHDDVAGPLAEHALEEVGAGVDFQLPGRRLLGAAG